MDFHPFSHLAPRGTNSSGHTIEHSSSVIERKRGQMFLTQSDGGKFDSNLQIAKSCFSTNSFMSFT